MLNEPSFVPQKVGWIEVICGGMFSGKTEELIRRAKRAHIAGQKVVIVKPAPGTAIALLLINAGESRSPLSQGKNQQNLKKTINNG